MKRFLASPFFLLAVAAFFLPFFSVQCAGGGLGDLDIPGAQNTSFEADVTGFELATGQGEESLQEDFGGQNPLAGVPTPDIPLPGPSISPGLIPSPDTGAVEGQFDLGTAQIYAIVAAAVALLGIFLSLVGGRAGGIVALILGAGGAVMLFLLASSFKDAILGDAPDLAENVIDVKNEIGFWLSLGGFVVAAVAGLIRVFLPDRPAGATPYGTPPPSAPPPSAPPESPPPATAG